MKRKLCFVSRLVLQSFGEMLTNFELKMLGQSSSFFEKEKKKNALMRCGQKMCQFFCRKPQFQERDISILCSLLWLFCLPKNQEPWVIFCLRFANFPFKLSQTICAPSGLEKPKYIRWLCMDFLTDASLLAVCLFLLLRWLTQRSALGVSDAIFRRTHRKKRILSRIDIGRSRGSGLHYFKRRHK